MRCYCGTSEVSLIGSCDLCTWAPPPTHCFPNSIVIAVIAGDIVVTLMTVFIVPFAAVQTH